MQALQGGQQARAGEGQRRGLPTMEGREPENRVPAVSL